MDENQRTAIRLVSYTVPREEKKRHSRDEIMKLRAEDASTSSKSWKTCVLRRMNRLLLSTVVIAPPLPIHISLLLCLKDQCLCRVKKCELEDCQVFGPSIPWHFVWALQAFRPLRNLSALSQWALGVRSILPPTNKIKHKRTSSPELNEHTSDVESPSRI